MEVSSVLLSKDRLFVLNDLVITISRDIISLLGTGRGRRGETRQKERGREREGEGERGSSLTIAGGAVKGTRCGGWGWYYHGSHYSWQSTFSLSQTTGKR